MARAISRMGLLLPGLLLPGLLAGLAGAQPGPTLLFQAEAQALSGSCAGGAVRVEGNHNTLALSGPCGSLLLQGVSNTVRLAVVGGGAIRVEGSGNRVSYTPLGAAPAVVALGPDNEVTASGPRPAAAAGAAPVSLAPARTPPAPALPGGQPAALPAGPLLLAGNDQHGLENCAGRDVSVTGDRSAYVVSGGCRSLVVRGDLLTVQAEMAPNARIAVTGKGSIVSWALQRHGRPPVTTVHGEGSRVQRAEATGGDRVR